MRAGKRNRTFMKSIRAGFLHGCFLLAGHNHCASPNRADQSGRDRASRARLNGNGRFKVHCSNSRRKRDAQRRIHDDRRFARARHTHAARQWQSHFCRNHRRQGSASPAGYQVTLNGNCSLRYLRTQTTPVSLPAVTAPRNPTGTRTCDHHQRRAVHRRCRPHCAISRSMAMSVR